MKAIIFDASSLIGFAMNGLFNELRELKNKFNGKFIIPKEVKEEIIDYPITRKKFELEALRLQKLIKDKVIELPESLGVKDAEISKRTKEILESVNNSFVSPKRNINLIHSGEASCLALSEILVEKNIEHIIAVDERTTRMIIENPEGLKKLLEKRLYVKIKADKEKLKRFLGIKVIRSTELVYVAYKKGVFKIQDKRLLDALLWAVKLKGCSVSNEEINEIKKIG